MRSKSHSITFPGPSLKMARSSHKRKFCAMVCKVKARGKGNGNGHKATKKTRGFFGPKSGCGFQKNLWAAPRSHQKFPE